MRNGKSTMKFNYQKTKWTEIITNHPPSPPVISELLQSLPNKISAPSIDSPSDNFSNIYPKKKKFIWKLYTIWFQNGSCSCEISVFVNRKRDMQRKPFTPYPPPKALQISLHAGIHILKPFTPYPPPKALQISLHTGIHIFTQPNDNYHRYL